MYEELDRRLVNVLQIDPRASWAKVGKVLGVSPTTVAHRWQRLVDDGIAWITACSNLNQQMTAIVEVDCHTESLPQVIKTLCANLMIVSIDETTGDRDLLLTVVAPDLPTLSDMVIDWIGGLRGVHGSRSALVTSVVIGSNSWRIDALSKAEKILARGHRPGELWMLPPDDLDRELAQELAVDGRTSATSLARTLDVPASTLHRRLQKLLTNRQIELRCDVAPELGGWSLECTWTATIPLNHKTRVLELLRQQSGLRSCMWITGSNNLRVNFRVERQSGIGMIESAVAEAIPGLAPAETIVYMRSHKSMGWVLDRDGRATGEFVCPPLIGAFERADH
ncbi:Lrp/AsnC family transcriptional regulator [Cutibacterium acnes]|nr:Lrp/AsnC family transcriptional regulator [Cutibacterium acnes]OFK54152.1 AsnC family transcriptional regulator [Propionibacterium sp. HMSC069G10]PIS93548.1 Lrp/AsnC family transcriptional regulator [Cutibacterium acnes]WHE31306.1 Lrp/AsnC family transcriptional regulator [Cutibacterium acnes subsp. acnes]